MESTDVMESDISEAPTSENFRHDENASNKEDYELWEDLNENCFLCDKSMEPAKSFVVKERGINSFIQASYKRKDKKHLVLQNLKEITIHKACQKMYTRESNIKIALQASAETWRKNRQRRQEGRFFDFSINCFFCSNRCLEKLLKKLRKRLIDIMS